MTGTACIDRTTEAQPQPNGAYRMAIIMEKYDAGIRLVNCSSFSASGTTAQYVATVPLSGNATLKICK